MSSRTTARAIGALFLAAFVVYLAGGALVETAGGDRTRLAVGALLMLLNSAVVAGIGVLAFPVLRAHDEPSAHAYLIGRAIEAALLAVGIVFLLVTLPEGNHYSYQFAMIAVGAVGVLLCRVLFRARLVHRALAVWGLVGYGLLLIGAVLEVLGHGVGVAFAVPGGLFEVALGVLLVVKGFSVTAKGSAAVANAL